METLKGDAYLAISKVMILIYMVSQAYMKDPGEKTETKGRIWSLAFDPYRTGIYGFIA